ncbi:MAG: fibronectin type III domain-containing protein [Acidobacteriia bacterium]|nr:fibronectin type III domain-containing protein [Terriglobia bacterium]
MAAQPAALTVGNASAAAGMPVDLGVTLAPGTATISTLQFDLTLAPGLTYVSMTTGAAAAAAGKTAVDSVIPGGVRVLIFGLNQNAIGSGSVTVMTLNIAGGSPAGSLPVGITGIVASDPLGFAVTTSGSGGSVLVTAPADTKPPVITGVAASSLTQTGATITWSTDEGSDTQVEYGTSVSYGGFTALNTSLVTSHSTSLSGLTVATLYHYRVRSRDAAGNLATSADFTLTTLAGNSECAPANVRCVAAAAGPTQEYTTIQAAAEAAQPGDTVLVYDGTYAGFQVSSSGTAAAPIHFEAAGRNAVINVDGPTGDGIRLQNVSYVSVDGFYIESPSKRCVAAVGASPVAPMQGLSIRNNTCHASAGEGFFLSDVGGGVIELNSIINAGRGNKPTGHGISLSGGGSDNTTLRGNLISGSGGDGVSVSGNAAAGGDGIIQGLLMEDNSISGGRRNGMGLDGVQDAVLQNNLVYANGRSALRGYQSAGAQGPRNLTVVSNTLLVPPGGEYAIRLTEDQGGHTLFDNIVLSDSTSGGSVAVSNRSLVTGSNGVVDRFSLDGGTTQISLAQWQAAGYEGGSFMTTAADLFVNVAGNDYHLKAGSAAIDKGRASLAAAAAPGGDLEGNSRPQGNGYDVGSYESPVRPADITPPTISGITVPSITTSSATINWTTDEPSDSQVEYGTTTSYGNFSTLSSSLVSNHSVVLSGLSAATTYYFRVRSRDGSGNLALSTGFSLTTQVVAQSLTVFNVLVTNVASRQATIQWTTNLPSTSQVEYGTSIRLGALSALDPALVTDHTVTLTNLKGGRTFYFRVSSKDAQGILVVSSVSSFIAAR